MNKLLTVLSVLLLFTSCGQQSKLLEVDVFRHRTTELVGNDAAMIRGDQQYVMFEAISNQERGNSLGQYYTVRRSQIDKPAEVVFYYLQGRTGSKVLRKKISFGVGEKRRVISIIGEDYRENGRVLAWKVDLLEQGEVVASEQSYLWAR